MKRGINTKVTTLSQTTKEMMTKSVLIVGNTLRDWERSNKTEASEKRNNTKYCPDL